QIYKNIFEEWFQKQIRENQNLFINALLNKEVETAERILNMILFKSISYYDHYESFYHGFMMGMLTSSGYRLKSNREAGDGRFDLVLLPAFIRDKGIVFEFKLSTSNKDLEKTATDATIQIKTNKYLEGLKEEGYSNMMGYGISFYKKQCTIKLCE
ncbi:MAG: PD-(D/E)XK nuclease domain-containing protein, partial [Floccifex sp.]